MGGIKIKPDSSGRGGELETSMEYSLDGEGGDLRRGCAGRLKAGLVGLALLVGVGSSGGCLTPRGEQFANTLGAAATQQFISNSIDQSMGVNRGTEVNVHGDYGDNNNVPENVYFRDGRYYPIEGYKWVNPNNQKDLRVMPENVYFRDGRYYPEPGYTWVNPNNQKDLSVAPIRELLKIKD